MLKFFSGAWSLTYLEQAKLLASDKNSADQFGFSVAASSDGNTVIIGAINTDTSPSTNSGAAYVFTRSGTTWSQQQKLVASDYGSSDNFGRSVAISSDGNTVLVGSPLDDTPFTNAGSAYVFTRSGSTWTEQQRLSPSDVGNSDKFGTSVALSSDGDTAIAGSPEEDDSGTLTNGAAYVFTRSGSTWTQQQKLLASDKADVDFFGWSVALSSDGNTAAIGAIAVNTSPYVNNGAAYIFTRSGSTWTEQQKLTASDAQSDEQLGYSIDLSNDGNTVLIGAYLESTSPLSENGAAYVFTRSGSTWSQQAKLLANNRASTDKFGQSVSLAGDGNTALIGAPSTTNGTSYIFSRAGSSWTQQQALSASDASAGDNFGIAVALSSDGSTAVVGADLESTSPYSFNGATYVFVSS
jgi:predicted amidohydrolase